MAGIILGALALAFFMIGCGFLGASCAYPFTIKYSLISFGLSVLMVVILFILK